MLTDIWTVFWRDWIVLKRRLGRYILSRMITPLLYLVAFGWGLGQVMQSAQGNYLDFIVPGIIALNSMTISFTAVGTPVNQHLCANADVFFVRHLFHAGPFAGPFAVGD
jgi:hypothetical protein